MPGIFVPESSHAEAHGDGGREEIKAVFPRGHSKTSFDADRVISKSNGHGTNEFETIDSPASLGRMVNVNNPDICVLPAPDKPPIMRAQSSQDLTVTITRIIEETHQIVHTCKKRIGSHSDSPFGYSVTLESLTNFIHAQRLRDMPDKGSTWDKILRWALTYAKRIDEFSSTIEPYFKSSPSMARDIWSCCRSLLQLSNKDIHIALMLKSVFEQFYRIGESLDNFREHKKLFESSQKMQKILVRMFSDIVKLTIETTTFYKQQRTISRDCIQEYTLCFTEIVNSFDFHKKIFEGVIWDHCIETSEEIMSYEVSVETIRTWLLTGHKEINIISEAEGTCLWFDKHLMDFEEANDEIFAIYGRGGIGKSVLAKWITSRLMTHQKGVTLFYSMDSNTKSSTSSLALARSLVSQLLERRLGDVRLYKKLRDIYDSAASGQALEQQLWKAFEKAAKSTWQLTIVVDGLDHIQGGFKAANDVITRISKIAKENGENTLKAIVLCKQFPERFSSSVKTYKISDEDVEEDIENFVETSLRTWSSFRSLTYDARRKVTVTIVTQSKGSFSWASLTLQLIRREKTFEGVFAVLGKPCKDLDELTERVLVSLNWKDIDTRRILSWLLFAKQDLTATALKELLDLEFKKKATRNTRFSKFEEDLKKACGSIVVIDNGIVRFSTPDIKIRLLKIVEGGKHHITVKQCHQEITFGCWAYVSVCELDSSTRYFSEETLSVSSLQELYKRHHLLEYCARHWVKHYQHYAGDTIIVDDHCKALFPTSSFFCQIERAIWSRRRVEEKHISKYFNFSVDIRERLCGQSHASVVQSVLNLAYIFETFFAGKKKHVDHYHRAWTLARQCFKQQKHHAFIMTCATRYIESVEKHEHIHRDEEVYKWTYTHCKHVCGESHKDTVRYAIILGQLYIRKEKKELACNIFKEVWIHCRDQLSATDELFITISDHYVHVLELTEKYKEIIIVRKHCIVDVSTTTKIWDLTRVRNHIKLALAYRFEGEYEETEKTLVQVILGITESFKTCDHHEHVHIHIARIEATLAMSEFFRSQHRHHDCENLLVELWKETISVVGSFEEHSDSFMEVIVTLAKEMELLEMSAVAIEVYTTLRNYLKKSTTLITTDIARVVSLRLAVLCEHDIVIQEEILKETFEVIIKTTTTTETIIETTTTLVSFYEKHENWTQVVSVCSQTLTHLWAAILSVSVKKDIYVPRDCHHETIELAWRLALAYERSREITRAEQIYVGIFHACRRSLSIKETITFEAVKKIIHFYETHKHHQKAVQVYVDLFDSCHTEFGIAHFRSLEVCYELARLHIRLGNSKEAEKLYLKIWSGCLTKSRHCIQGSLEAGWSLCELYEQAHRHEEAIQIYQILWDSACDIKIKVTVEDSRLPALYKQFKRVLMIESKFELLYEVTTVFEHYCKRVHGETHHLTIEAMLELATTIERIESRKSEAVRIYERIVEISTEITVTEEVKKTVIITKRRLAKCYSSSTTTVTKAEETYVEIWTSCKHTHGISHTSTLEVLEELIVFHKSRKSVTKALEVLQATIIEIFNTERDSEKLFRCGLSLAKCYRSLGCIDEGAKFCKDLHKFLFTYKGGMTVKDPRFIKWTVRQVNGSIVDRKYQVFLFAFEEVLRNESAFHDHHLFSYILSTLLAETELYESWTKTITVNVKCEQKLLHGCRLIAHLAGCHRGEESLHIKEQLWVIFQAQYTHKHIEVDTKILRELFEKCVVETTKVDREIIIVDIAITQIEEYVKKHEFKSVSILSTWTHTHIKITQNTTASLKLVSILSSSTVIRYCKEEATLKKITEITETIIIESVSETTTTISWHERSIKELNKVILLLGSKKNYSRMLLILEELWEHRTLQASWTPGVVSLIGRRLVETYFVLGEKTKALKLCERICYNYERVWGLLNPTTLDFYDFLSGLYVASKKFEKAISVHERILQQAMGDKKTLADGTKINEILLRQTELLKAAFDRSYAGKEIAADEREHQESFFHRVTTFFTGDADCKKQVENLKTKKYKEDFGCWKSPEKWEIVEYDEDEEETSGYKPQIFVRNADGTCGTLNGTANGTVGKNGLRPDIMKRDIEYHHQRHFSQSLASEIDPFGKRDTKLPHGPSSHDIPNADYSYLFTRDENHSRTAIVKKTEPMKYDKMNRDFVEQQNADVKGKFGVWIKRFCGFYFEEHSKTCICESSWFICSCCCCCCCCCCS